VEEGALLVFIFIPYDYLPPSLGPVVIMDVVMVLLIVIFYGGKVKGYILK
jgi:hypothetical protein